MRSILLCYCLSFLASSGISQTAQINTIPNSPLVQIPFKGAMVPFPKTSANDRMLWYKGKKVNDSILLTSEAQLVLYSMERNMVVCQPLPKTDPALKIITELSKTEQRKSQLYDKLAEHKSSIMLYPFIIATFNEFDRIEETYNEALKNTIELPSLPITALNSQGMQRGGYASLPGKFNFAVIPAYVKKAYEEVVTSMKNYPPIDFPPPPSSEFSSCSNQCDTMTRKRNGEKEYQWLIAFTEYEAGIIQKSLSIYREINKLGLEQDAEAIPIHSGLEKAILFAFARASNKVDLLIRKYGNDFTRLPSIVRAALSVERQQQLVGINEGKANESVTERLIPLFDGFEKYLDQQMAERNYDLVFNMVFIISIERQRQLLGREEGTAEYVESYFQKLNAFNRFKVEVQMEYEGVVVECDRNTKERFTAINSEEVFASMYLIGCKFMFFPAAEHLEGSSIPVHYGQKFYFSLKITNGNAYEEKWSEDGENCELITHQLQGLIVRPTMFISGLSFCDNNQKDSLQFQSLHLPVSHEGRNVDTRYRYWEFDEFNTLIINDGFQDEYPEFLQSTSIELEALEAQQGMHQTKPIKKPSLPEMEEHYKNAARAYSLRKLFNEYEERNNPSVVEFDAQNKSEIIIDEVAKKKYYADYDDARHKDADIKIKIRITHSPSPYKPTAKN